MRQDGKRTSTADTYRTLVLYRGPQSQDGKWGMSCCNTICARNLLLLSVVTVLRVTDMRRARLDLDGYLHTPTEVADCFASSKMDKHRNLKNILK